MKWNQFRALLIGIVDN